MDADGKTIVPGLIDGHCHFYNLGIFMQKVDLAGTDELPGGPGSRGRVSKRTQVRLYYWSGLGSKRLGQQKSIRPAKSWISLYPEDSCGPHAD
jgi:hypothetical protein